MRLFKANSRVLILESLKSEQIPLDLAVNIHRFLV